MNILNTIKAIFDSPSKETVPHDIDAYATKHLVEVSTKANVLMKKYGVDFYDFFYQPQVDTTLRQELVPFIYPNNKKNSFLDYNHWSVKHPFNFPGTFYTGESDTCGTGDSEAPKNVLYDSYCCEYIFRQPQAFDELLCIIDAAAVEVFDSYSCNGNNFWTYQKCKDWWNNKEQLLMELKKPDVREVNGDRIQLYIDYLNGDAETDLKRYCYFLENGKYPTQDTTILPRL